MKFKLSKTQILVTGVYRTGSEYFTHLLNSFSEVSASMYRVNLMRFIYKRYCPINSSCNLLKALDDLNTRLNQRYSITVDKKEFLKDINQNDLNYGDLYDKLMTYLYLQDHSANIWAEKCQLLWRESEDFLKIMRNGKVILIHRDPRSVLASFKHYTNAPDPHYLGAVFNCLDAMQHGLRLEKKYPLNVLNIKYEDLIFNEKFIMDKVAQFLNLKNRSYHFHPSKLIDSYGKAWISNSSFHNVSDGTSYDKGKTVTRWKEVLCKSEIQLTERICSNMMLSYNYELTYDKCCDSSFSILKNDALTESYLNNFLNNGTGIQAFPSDPMNPKNWDSN